MSTKLRNLKLPIVDEVSMLGSKQFNYIDHRLQDIFSKGIDFGGINFVLVRDLLIWRFLLQYLLRVEYSLGIIPKRRAQLLLGNECIKNGIMTKRKGFLKDIDADNSTLSNK